MKKQMSYITSRIKGSEFDPNSEESKAAMENMSFSEACALINEKITECKREKRRIDALADIIVLVVEEEALELMELCEERKGDWERLIFKLLPASLTGARVVEEHFTEERKDYTKAVNI